MRHASDVRVDPQAPHEERGKPEGEDTEPVESTGEPTAQRIDLERGEQRERHQERQRIGKPDIRLYEEPGQDHEREHAGEHDADVAQAAVEAATAQPEGPYDERQRGPGEPRKIA